MKSFIVSLVLFFGVITGVTLLSVWNVRTVSAIHNEVILLNDHCREMSENEMHLAFFKIVDAWERESPRLSYSVNRRELSDIDAAIYEARGALEGGDEALFLSGMRMLEARMQELYELVGLHMQNIT